MVTLGGIQNPCLKNAIDDFNNADNGYKIIFRDYMDYYDSSYETDAGTTPEAFSRIDTQLSLDIIEGGIVDIVLDSVFCDFGKYDSLTKQGAFADLYEFMQAENYDNSVLYNHIIELYEIDGKLCCMPIMFQVDTVAGYTRYVGDKENWALKK